LVRKSSTSVQTELAAEAHITGGKFLLEEQELKTEKFLICSRETRKLAVSERKGMKGFKEKVNLNKK
jgi:hypothetical protein